MQTGACKRTRISVCYQKRVGECYVRVARIGVHYQKCRLVHVSVFVVISCSLNCIAVILQCEHCKRCSVQCVYCNVCSVSTVCSLSTVCSVQCEHCSVCSVSTIAR